MSGRRQSESSEKTNAKLVVNIGELLTKTRASFDANSNSHQDTRKNKSGDKFPYFCSLENFESAVVYLSQVYT